MKSRIIFQILIIPIILLGLAGCNFSFTPRVGGGGHTSSAKGVFRTDNQGLTWTEQNKLEGGTGDLSRYDTYKLVFDIFDKKNQTYHILYRSTDVGLFISQNAGDSWRQLNSSFINDFILNPKTRGLIYIASGSQVFKTTDNGQNWKLIYSEARPNVTIVSLAISYFDSSHVYILTNDGVLLLSSDWGESWKTIYNFKNQQAKQLLISPHNSQILFVAADNNLYRSIDEGISWQEIINKHKPDFPGIERYTHLYFTQQPKELIYLCRYGIFKSYDNGDNFQLVSLISSPNSVDINALSFNLADTDEIYYSVGNILYHTVDNGRNWKTKLLPVPAGAKASQLLIDPNNANVSYLAVRQ